MTDIIVDMQLGSSGKGKYAQYLSNNYDYNLYIKGGGINAGHTIYINDEKVKLQLLPVGTFSRRGGNLLLDPSTITTFDILKNEVELAEKMGFTVKGRLTMDPYVGFITKSHIEEESLLINKIGSVGTGTGPARISRLRRDGSLPTLKHYIENKESYVIDFIKKYDIRIEHSYKVINEYGNRNSLIEGYQATHLDVLHSRFYPYCTSWGTTASALAWNAGIAPHDVKNIFGVFCPILTRPGVNSGPTYPDSKELTWEELKEDCGADIDLTEIAATSGRKRRVFTFSKQMFQESIILNRPTQYALIRADYVDWKLKNGLITEKLRTWLSNNIEIYRHDILIGSKLKYISMGPKEEDYIK